MAEYYYFASTLPMLDMTKEAPISYSGFMAAAKDNLSARDYRDLEKAVLSPSGDSAKLPVVRSWQEYVGESGDRLLEEKIRRIIEDLDPLQAERAVLSLYFDFLSSEEGGSPFSSRALMIYALKLQLIERSSSFSEEKGSKEFDRLYKTIEEDIFR